MVYCLSVNIVDAEEWTMLDGKLKVISAGPSGIWGVNKCK